MRTTLQLNDDLMRQAKEFAAQSGRTLTAVIEDALRELFQRRQRQKEAPRVELPTFSSGLMPGVDLNNSAGLLEIMDEDDAPF
jgi:hypothetical protein